MDFNIREKKAIITGAGKGIGKSIAKNLAKEGVRLAIVSRTESDLKDLINEIGDEDKHYIITSDLSKEGEPERVYKEIKKNFGEPNILVNNLGSTLDIKNPFCSIEDWRKVYRINFEVAVELDNLVIPYMEKEKWGRIVNISSTAGMENNGPITYCSAKAALTAYTRSLGRILAKTGIVVSAILPGTILTEGGYWEKQITENPKHVEEYLKERCPSGYFGEPNDIGTLATFLCSEQAKFCQGSIFPVDGGQSRHYFFSGD